jgi:hypothetical protein
MIFGIIRTEEHMNAGSTFTTALIRSLYGALVVGVLAGLTALQQGLSDRDAIIAAGVAGVGYLATRGGFEGLYDATRQAAGDVKPGDVQPNDKGNI